MQNEIIATSSSGDGRLMARVAKFFKMESKHKKNKVSNTVSRNGSDSIQGDSNFTNNKSQPPGFGGVVINGSQSNRIDSNDSIGDMNGSEIG